ncbi:hypothetical protein [Oceanicoccus sagamiensis]|uniref:Uncharacterized protein n=1 Tax=Oceanicoccus sagamiensis TaxID=716816 RepID=A0A1X9NLT2_9GAMM|nr:hypothetical protein [Oceanicoccus sagamiensis]ARN76339.1 hypothetical protein BST96_08240 [Oceanicoccus sagamiensis]
MVEWIIGIILAVLTLYLARKNRLEGWLYTAPLFALPSIYMAFALFADGSGVILNEFLFGIPFFIAGAVFLKWKIKYSALMLALLWLGHGYYDIDHNRFFINSGTPQWYPLLCAGYDGVMGIYLIYFASTLKDGNLLHYRGANQ